MPCFVPSPADAVWNPSTELREPATCAWIEADLAGRAALTLPDAGISRALTLPRARLNLGVDHGELASARLGLAVVRSGGEAGYVGVDGEALVPEVQIAEARAAWPAWGLAAGLGVVDDPWVATGDAAWGLRAVAPGFGEAAGWMDSSDLGAWLAWSAPERLVTARVDLSAGEGARYRERNEGKDVAATVSVRPLARRDAFVGTIYARDGSRGLGLARDHRVGFRVGGTSGPVTWGAEGLGAWGVGGDAARQPVAASVWLVARPIGPLLAFGRLDLASEALGDDDAGTRTILAGAGVELPGDTRPIRLLVGYSGTRVGEHVADISGAAALNDEDTLYLQLGVTLAAKRSAADPQPSPKGSGSERIDR